LNVIDSKRQDADVRVPIEDGESQTTEFKSTLRTDVTLNYEEICVVNVDQGSRPAYLEHKHGEEQEFYVRQGNRTVPLEPKHQAEYVRDEFE
jgi:hypothetical protein